MSGEFALIERHFTWPAPGTDLAVGDDAALVTVGAGMQLAVSTDLLVSGTHFFAATDPQRLGHKALAVNLSDMAAMGARPRWATLALALPAALAGDDDWLAAFSRGMRSLADAHSTALIGGDTTRGPLAMCVTIFGEVPSGQAIRRDGARAGDDIWVSGALGEAAVALAHLNGGGPPLDASALDACRARLEMPQPRVGLGLALRALASAAIDVSDGLAADLGHILDRSGVAARVQVDLLPVSPALEALRGDVAVQDAIIAGGDDYELCFTAPASARADVAAAAQAACVPVTRVGKIEAGSGLVLVDAAGCTLRPSRAGFDHFG
jgi:thiamine-monophosphate kinase